MDMKIRPGMSVADISGVGKVDNASMQNEVMASAAGTADPVTQIALDLMEGRIDTSAAVDALIQQTMSTEMIAAAPDSLRQEVADMLKNVIDTDPYLISLTQSLE